MSSHPFDLSIVIPARNEEGNVLPLLEEIDAIFAESSFRWEVVFVDDASSDSTLIRLQAAILRYPTLKGLSLAQHCGKSAALAAGIVAAEGCTIGMMDADLQNCPHDFLAMLRMMDEDPSLALIQGHRSCRQDSWARNWASAVGFWMRRMILRDQVRDSGCAIRLIRRQSAADLPLHYEGMHRFIPFLVKLQGGKVVEIPVGHRPRRFGHSKYRIGPVSRGLFGFFDLLAVRWMMWRRRKLAVNRVSHCDVIV